MYLEQYKKKYKNNPIYMFSSLKEDESLDSVKPQRFKINDSLHQDPIKVEELASSCVIFDDIDVISNKKIKEAVYDILNQVLEIGRHYKISCIVTNHLPTNGNWTRRILNESSCFVYFPASSSGKIKYVLTEYLDIDKKTKPEEEDTFTIDGKDLTGRNMAKASYDKIEKNIVDAYSVLSDPEDKQLFYDYALSNLKEIFGSDIAKNYITGYFCTTLLSSH
jgi:hypothetical protein